MTPEGTHILLELFDCDPLKLNNQEFVSQALETAAIKAGAEVLSKTFHPFNPQGITGVVIIAESHITIHTWPEYSYAAVDIFTCGETVDPKKAVNWIVEAFNSKNFSDKSFKRGLHQKD